MKTQRFLAYLPNKKFILVVFLGLLLIGGGFLIFRNSTKEQKPQISQGISASKQIIVREISKDSDNDGLLDWEETLWKTDPNNADTDSDGTPDGQEIKENSQKIPEKSGAEMTETNETDSLGSLTEIVGQELFSNYLSLKAQKNGEALTEAEKNNLILSFSDKLENSSLLETAVIPPVPYIKSDIKIAQDSDPASIKEYGNNLALIIKKYFDPIPESELVVFAKAMQTKNPDEFEKIKTISNAYANTAKEMSRLAVPQNFSDSHLNLINNLANVAEDLKIVADFLSDPVAGFAAFSAYKNDAMSIYKILSSISGYFSENQVVFGNSEPGEYFKNYQ